MERKAGWRFSNTDFIFTDMDNMKVIEVKDGEEKEYQIGEGGGDITIEPLTVTENGTYEAESGKAYNPVTVDVEQGGGYSETLLWTNENTGSGFDTDKDCGYIGTGFDCYKIEWRTINNESVYLSTLWKEEDIRLGLCAITSNNEAGDLFARQITIEAVEVQSDPPMFEEHFIAKGLCSQIGADNPKRFRCLPYKIYGVNGVEF